jgi:hypothetical protein
MSCKTITGRNNDSAGDYELEVFSRQERTVRVKPELKDLYSRTIATFTEALLKKGENILTTEYIVDLLNQTVSSAKKLTEHDSLEIFHPFLNSFNDMKKQRKTQEEIEQYVKRTAQIIKDWKIFMPLKEIIENKVAKQLKHS